MGSYRTVGNKMTASRKGGTFRSGLFLKVMLQSPNHICHTSPCHSQPFLSVRMPSFSVVFSLCFGPAGPAWHCHGQTWQCSSSCVVSCPVLSETSLSGCLPAPSVSSYTDHNYYAILQFLLCIWMILVQTPFKKS